MDDLRQRRQQRLEKIYQYLKDGGAHRDCMRHFGLESSTFYESLARLKVLHPDFDPPTSGTNPKNPSTSDASYNMRARLGQLLWQLRDNGGEQRDRALIAELTGIPARKQALAETRPYDHDWSLSQIERLASALGTNFHDVIKKVAA